MLLVEWSLWLAAVVSSIAIVGASLSEGTPLAILLAPIPPLLMFLGAAAFYWVVSPWLRSTGVRFMPAYALIMLFAVRVFAGSKSSD